MNSRAVLHLDGANFFETLLTKVTALCEQIHSASLEVLIFVQVQLQKTTTKKQKKKNRNRSVSSKDKVFKKILIKKEKRKHLLVAQSQSRVTANAALST